MVASLVASCQWSVVSFKNKSSHGFTRITPDFAEDADVLGGSGRKTPRKLRLNGGTGRLY
jgi:hypothetical protein